MTDIKKETTKPLIDTEEFEEEISLVSSEQDITNNDAAATLDTSINAEWDEQPKRKEQPLIAAIVVEDYDSDPWAQPENALLAQEEEEEDEEEDLVVKQPQEQFEEVPSIATTTVFDAIDNHHEPIIRKDQDQDTSAIKVINSIQVYY